mmetsp:Transcript_16127/g.55073  ORF Transcript_16127/g.55073 Transcript_16127/m.55073 type:complete len:447 (+) Transcript_16127:126-1466(+)
MASANASEDYAAAHAEAAKKRGNAHFAAGENALAIEAYSEAIALDPENYVFYSNRSGAYLAAGNAISKAFKDGEKCVQLAPTWVKGHLRKGAAELALRRFAAAQASYRRAIELETGDVTKYREALQAAIEGEAVDAKERAIEAKRQAAEAEKQAALEEAAQARAAEEAAEAKRQEDLKNKGTLSLDDFFAEIGTAEEAKHKEKRLKTNPVHEKYATQKLGKSAEVVARLTQAHSKWRNLNPFYVMMLGTDATPDDIKARYRKLSALAHPDKNLGNESAREAFESVKDAYNRLLVKKDFEACKFVVDKCEKRFDAQRELDVLRGADEANLPDRAEGLERELLKTFAQNEIKRVDAEDHTRTHAERERKAEEAKKQGAEAETKFEDQWNQEDRRADRLNFWQQFQDDDERSRVQKRTRTAKNFKQEEHVPLKKKHGEADMNSWKKEWK